MSEMYAVYTLVAGVESASEGDRYNTDDFQTETPENGIPH